jgi:hypothetical protein
MLLPIAHAGHWLVSLSYFVPILGFIVWLVVVQIKERRGGDKGGDSGGS